LKRSKLDEIYSMSNKFTCKEMYEKMPNAEKISRNLQLEVLKYMDPFTKKVRNNIINSELRKICPLCESKDFEFIFEKHGFDHMLCNSCELIFTLQTLDPSKISYLEEGGEGDNYGEHKEISTVNELDQKKFEIVFEKLEELCKIKKIFDIGSQSGTFLDWAQEKFSVVGHEYHTPLRKICHKKGHNVLNDNLDTINLNETFDLITVWDYLDHIIFPHQVIQNISKYLKKDGLFFFAINNRDCLSARIMHKKSPIFIGPHHTMHYGINQLNILMKDFELIYSESYVSELNWISNWLNFKNPEFGDSQLMSELLNPEKICELGMGFKVNAIYRKK